jgi:VanZ family protein
LTRAGRALALYGPPVAWAAAIFAASSRSDIGAAAGIPDWITHGSAYAVLAFLTSRAVAGGIGRRLSETAFALVVAIVTLYGISDEYHQSFVPGRDPSLGDVLKDLGGAVVGSAVFRARFSVSSAGR